jgi:hypothetical protein
VEGKSRKKQRRFSRTVLEERRMRKRENRGREQKEVLGEGRISLLVLMSSSGWQGTILYPIIPWFFISC